jgi:hypothetical protein
MMQASELFTLARDLAHLKVLSVYIDNRVVDPSKRGAWRADLSSRLRNMRATIKDSVERAQFDRAAAFLDAPVPAPGGMWASPGWVAFATEHGVVVVGALSGRVETLVAWQQGAVIIPCLRAVSHEAPVLVGLLGARGALLYRYAHGVLEYLETVDEPPSASRQRRRGLRSNRAGRGYPTPRGALKTEVAHERQLAQSHRLATSVAARLGLVAGRDDCIIVVGGAPQQTRVVFDALPQPLQRRTVVSSALDRGATHDTIVRGAKRAAREWRSRHGRLLVSRIFNHSGQRGVAGLRALEWAVYQKAVDLLLVSPRFLDAERERAEQLLLAALGQGAAVEVLSGDAAALLDTVGDGVGARLRFSVDPRAAKSAMFDREPAPVSPRAS